MPLNSVMQYVANALNGLALPLSTTGPLEAYITPPTIEDLDRPKAYVWGSRMRGKRQTAPRTTTIVNGLNSGYKELSWVIDVYLVYETEPDAPMVDQEFPTIVDAVMAKLWTLPMTTVIVDPTTGVQSQIISVGEEFNLEMHPERTPNTLRMLFYSARISFDVYEAVQA